MRTLRQSLEHMLEAAKNDRLGAHLGLVSGAVRCMYRDKETGKRCIIGCLLTDEQCDMLDYKGVNDVATASSLESYKVPALAENSLTSLQAMALQWQHDVAVRAGDMTPVINWLTTTLETGRGAIMWGDHVAEFELD